MSFKVGPLSITVQRTVRVPEGRAPSQLPPGFGAMKLYYTKDYRDKCPETWEDESVFVVLHKQEALWLSFIPSDTCAIICGAGGVNALTGKELCLKLEKDNYMVAPPQPWLDGWKDEDGTVYQFVATEYQKGDGVTVGEQILGDESKSGGIGIAVFEPKDRQFLKPVVSPSGGWIGGQTMCFSAQSRSMPQSFIEMGVGKGGKIIQKIYPDPYGLEVWKDEPISVKAIYMVGADAFTEITGETAPPSPVTSESYGGSWYGLQDEKFEDIEGSKVFTGLKSVFSTPSE